MSTLTVIALAVLAFSAGAVLGVLAMAACAAGSREDAFRRGYLLGLRSKHPEEEEEALQAQCDYHSGDDDEMEVTR